ncbi:hypothetical protein CRENBAI_019770 [Crenichthys baileyi]|uniref:Uncharacterized protein n=1 Tax=Crenichthys baileyi TaxID=28760 RepID=A0AAV9SP86_9TELE
MSKQQSVQSFFKKPNKDNGVDKRGTDAEEDEEHVMYQNVPAKHRAFKRFILLNKLVGVKRSLQEHTGNTVSGEQRLAAETASRVIPLIKTSPAPSGWTGYVCLQPFSDLCQEPSTKDQILLAHTTMPA